MKTNADMEKIGNQVATTIENVGCVIGETLGLIETSGTIFVTGACGVIGNRVANRLLDAGYPTVRVGARCPTKVEGLNERGAEVADFCWELEETYDKALVGVKSVFCTTPYCEQWSKNFPGFLKACKRAGVKNFVKVSFYHARETGDTFQTVPLVALHGLCDELLVKSDIPCTIISATHFMSNPFVFQGKKLRSDMKPAPYYGASKQHKVNYVSPNDVAEVAVRVLLAPKSHHGKEYTLTGPEAITDQEVAGLLSRFLDKPIMYADQPLHFFEDMEKTSGHPIWMVRDLVALEEIKASGKEEEKIFISNDFEVVCGHKAETFEEYLMAKDRMTPMECA